MELWGEIWVGAGDYRWGFDYFYKMIGEIPYVNPTLILKFFNEYPIKIINKSHLEVGQKFSFPPPRLADYFLTIPIEYTSKPPFIGMYHNALLRMTQKLVNEGLLTPVGNKTGFEQQFLGNGYEKNEYLEYGYYDFLIYGFSAIRKNFEEAVRPVIINSKSKEKDEGIGTGFVIRYNNKIYFITARHCLPKNSLITIIPFLPQRPQIPKNVFFSVDTNIDIAVIEFSDNILLSNKWFLLSQPNILDEVLTMGFPPIQGFIEPIQISETATIATSLKSSTGIIAGQGQHYGGGFQNHFLISARVKGGNSGGPVINQFGFVVGVVIETLQDGNQQDLLGYGMAISSDVIMDILNAVEGKDNKIKVQKCEIFASEGGFNLK